jgi:CubicO group peptidase (beta-lactamase class C family)
MTAGLDEARSFGWQLASTENSTAGPRLAPDSFGHLGFTGTSCWVDPARDAVFYSPHKPYARACAALC